MSILVSSLNATNRNETLEDVYTLKAHRVLGGLDQVDRVYGTSIVIGTSQ